jgi:hypothetical protein
MGTPDNLYQPPYALTQFPGGINSAKRPVMGSVKMLTSVQLLALQTTAIVIEPSPSVASVTGSVQLVLQLERASFEYIFPATGGTAYTIANADNAFQIEYVGKAVALASVTATGLVDQTASTFVSVAASNAGKIALTNCQNLGFEVKLVGTTPALTLGNGIVKVVLDWTIISLPV